MLPHISRTWPSLRKSGPNFGQLRLTLVKLGAILANASQSQQRLPTSGRRKSGQQSAKHGLRGAERQSERGRGGGETEREKKTKMDTETRRNGGKRGKKGGATGRRAARPERERVNKNTARPTSHPRQRAHAAKTQVQLDKQVARSKC